MLPVVLCVGLRLSLAYFGMLIDIIFVQLEFWQPC